MSSSKPQKDFRKLSVFLPEWTRKVDQSNYNFKYFFRPSIWAVVCGEDKAIYGKAFYCTFKKCK
jgi:hypothetical protein